MSQLLINIPEFHDTYLEDIIDYYQKDPSIHQFKLILSALTYIDIIFCYLLQIKDFHYQTVVRKQHSLSLDILNNQDICFKDTPLAKVNDKWYFCLFTSNEKFDYKKINYVNALEIAKFHDIYKQFIQKNDECSGVIINVYNENFILDKDFCEYIYNGCKKEDWRKITDGSFRALGTTREIHKKIMNMNDEMIDVLEKTLDEIE